MTMKGVSHRIGFFLSLPTGWKRPDVKGIAGLVR